uniref:LAGLIDADG endonuclease n=1 Tax=Orbilia oligospora TaxID=2813651 RepID=A0A6G6A3T1_ORBOL|nr:LAGLIDADG endonuclease [Orbilia oligospora]
MNKGLSDELALAFPNTIPVLRPIVLDQVIKDINWFVGFVNAEGSFFIKINESKNRIGFSVGLRFQITQHLRDEKLLKSFIPYLGCGYYSIRSSNDVADFLVLSFSDINDKIIPLFAKYPILGIKRLDYDDFCKVAELMKNKDHLTKEGLEKIIIIRKGMNRNRS